MDEAMNESKVGPLLRGSAFSRRSFLYGIGTVAAGAALAACGSGDDESSSSSSATGGGGAGKSKTVTIWWENGFNDAENNAITAAVEKWQEQSNVKADLQFFSGQSLPVKIESAVEAGQVPDIVYSIGGNHLPYAWDGRLADLSDVLAAGSFTEPAKTAARIYNKKKGDYGIYHLPLYQYANIPFYWVDMLAEIGMSPQDVPTGWDDYWGFWKDAQDAYRKKSNPDIWGVGWAMSADGNDATSNVLQILLANNVELLDKDGALQVDNSDVFDGIVESLDWISKLYNAVSPPTAITWDDSGNNSAIINKDVLMTPNPSLSITASLIDTDDYDAVQCAPWPDRPNGERLPAGVLMNSIYIFESSEHQDEAKDFLSFLIEDDNMDDFLRGGMRFYPNQESLMAKDFWTADSPDSHVAVVAKQLTGNAYSDWSNWSIAYRDVMGQHLWGKAIGDIVLAGKSPKDASTDVAAAMKDIFAKYEM